MPLSRGEGFGTIACGIVTGSSFAAMRAFHRAKAQVPRKCSSTRKRKISANKARTLKAVFFFQDIGPIRMLAHILYSLRPASRKGSDHTHDCTFAANQVAC